MSEDLHQKRTDINELGEFGLIEHLTSDFADRHKSTVKGIGDDAAVIQTGDDLTIVSTDLLVEGIHFDLMYTPLKHLGYKAVVANISDICAMNAEARQITVSIAISNRFSVEALEEFYSGIKAACDYYRVDLVGGDTTSSTKGLLISVTAIGVVSPDKVVYRSGAKEGDLLCISGNLGAAYLGLQILEREKQLYLSNPGIQPDLENQAYLVGRQLKPEARVDMIEFFEKSKLIPTAMIDISDGLASEVFHLCKQSGLGAYVEESGIPIHPEAEAMALKFQLDPVTCALSGGEDYELLFAVDPKDIDKVKYLPDLYIAGEMVARDEGVKLHTKGGNIHPLKAQGWQHFLGLWYTVYGTCSTFFLFYCCSYFYHFRKTKTMSKNILITGASSGIGEATARRLASEGHNVVLMARRKERLESLKSNIEAEGGKAFIHSCDVTDFEKVKAEVAAIVNHLGSIDVVVNNAGLMPLSFFKNGKIEEANKMVDVNIKGVLNLIYAVLPAMIENNKGHFVNVSSIAGKLVMPAGAVYCGTKFAVRAISEGLRQEMAMDKRNIRVTDIQPGAVTTELMGTITDSDAISMFQSWEPFEFLNADDIARGVAYAISQPDNVNVNELTIRPTQQTM